MKIEENIREMAIAAGFDLFGIAPAEPTRYAREFRSWIAAGMQAGMGWMARSPERRIDPRIVLKDAKSIVTVGISYFTQDPPAAIWDDPLRGRVARFAWGRDYHDVLTPRLKTLAEAIEHAVGGENRSMAYVDTGPLLERAVAQTAGIGQLGYNTNIIAPKYGSYIFLGEIITTTQLEPTAPSKPSEEICADCRRCLAACPTKALIEPYRCDSRRCISYLTIEHKGSIPTELRPMIGNWIFGCDACQECCPQLEQIAVPDRDKILAYQPELAAPQLPELLKMGPDEFRTRFKGTPIARVKRPRLLRNVAVALGNSGRREAIPHLERALADPEPLIGEHAAWAIESILRATV